jgi:integral membrane protein
MIKTFRIVALAEAASFLALLVASYLKHTGEGELGVTVLGPIHGALFVAYAVLALRLRERFAWSNSTTLWVLAGAVLPFGGFAVERWLARRGLTGAPS